MKNTSKQGKGLHPEQGHYALTVCCSQLILQHFRHILSLGFASDLTNIWISLHPWAGCFMLHSYYSQLPTTQTFKGN